MAVAYLEQGQPRRAARLGLVVRGQRGLEVAAVLGLLGRVQIALACRSRARGQGDREPDSDDDGEPGGERDAGGAEEVQDGTVELVNVSEVRRRTQERRAARQQPKR